MMQRARTIPFDYRELADTAAGRRLMVVRSSR
jgi:hypothetical protein